MYYTRKWPSSSKTNLTDIKVFFVIERQLTVSHVKLTVRSI